jgi:hypothetical protein
MSRTMQITTEVRPAQSLAGGYPNLARMFETLSPGLLGPAPSLLSICQRVDELQDKLRETALGRLLEAQADELRRAGRGVEKLLADWKLAEADQLLYQLEDRFDGLEAELKAPLAGRQNFRASSGERIKGT